MLFCVVYPKIEAVKIRTAMLDFEKAVSDSCGVY